MLYLHTPEDVACYCVSFVREAKLSNGDTCFNIEVFEKSSKLDKAFRFVRISGKSDSTEFAMSKNVWDKAKKCLESRWQITNTRTGEGISVSI